MGQYNPDAPYIIGQEWVPIRQADYQPDSITERGYTFGIDHAATIVSGYYYITSARPATDAAHFLAVYPEGTEDLTGPIKQVIIPAISTAVTGAGGDCSPCATSLTYVADGQAIFAGGTFAPQFGVSFDVAGYSQQLFGKRILDVSVLYTAAGTPDALARTSIGVAKLINPVGDVQYAAELLGLSSFNQEQIQAVSLSDLNPFWQPGITAPVLTPHQIRIYPWRYQELAQFATTPDSERLIVLIRAALSSLPASDAVAVGYMALQVTYCEEQRILYGGDYLNANGDADDHY